jgi:histidinol-phosphate aminotransferase
MYAITASAAGAVVDTVPLKGLAMDLDAMAERVTADTRLVFVCNPNNPTGTVITQKAFDRFMDRLPDDVVVVVDEAYIEFARNPDCLKTGQPSDVNRPLVTLRTFSKVYGLAGLRVGYGIMPASLAELLNRVRPPFNVNTMAQVAAAAALDDRAFLKQTVGLVHQGLDDLYIALDKLGLPFFKTEANFFLIDVGQPADAVFENMLRQGVIVRSMRAYGFPTYIRINVGLEAENRRFLRALKTVLSQIDQP